jgi:hypothetical protein
MEIEPNTTGQRPQVTEIPAGLSFKTEDREERKEFVRLSRERAAQRVELADVVRGELQNMVAQIPGVKEAALAAILNGTSSLVFNLPDGKTLNISGSNKYQEHAGSTDEQDEYGDYISGTGRNVSFEENSTTVTLRDKSAQEDQSGRSGINLLTRVWRYEDGSINSQDGHINTSVDGEHQGFGFFSNDAPTERVLQGVDKVEGVLRGYTQPPQQS